MKETKITRNKKGIFDLVFILVAVFAVALTIFFSVFIGIKFQEQLVPQFDAIDNQSSESMNATLNYAIDWGDWLILIVIFLAFLGMIISSFLFYSHPAFMVLWIILSIGLIVMSVIFANIYSDITSTAVFSTTLDKFPKADFIFSHFPLFTLILVAVSIIVIYVKSQSGGGQGI